MFSDRKRGYEIFGAAEAFKDLKLHQDELLAAKDPKYNHSLREFAKLMINSLSGKPNTKLYTSVMKYVKSE